jgi:hypothetical protein
MIDLLSLLFVLGMAQTTQNLHQIELVEKSCATQFLTEHPEFKKEGFSNYVRIFDGKCVVNTYKRDDHPIPLIDQAGHIGIATSTADLNRGRLIK